ncbi:hypothetical protein ACFPM7_29800, partial [Actinokineospora guangxiensis]
AGIGPLGPSPDPPPPPAPAAQAILATLTHPTLHCHLAVHNTTGLPDGWYSPDGTSRPAPAMDQTAAAFGYPPSKVHVAGMNLAVVITADIAAAVTAHGPAAYPRLLRSAGAIGQRVCSTAAEHGLFARPVRSVHEAAVEAAVEAPAGHDFLYLVLIGRSRVRCFPYDLSPLNTHSSAVLTAHSANQESSHHSGTTASM